MSLLPTPATFGRVQDPTIDRDWSSITLTAAPAANPVAGKATPVNASSPTAQLVLAEQWRAVRVWRHGAPGGRTFEPRLSTAERSRMVALAIAVLTQAARNAEAKCRRIISDAETEAATMVTEAYDDVARLTNWIESPLLPTPPAPRSMTGSIEEPHRVPTAPPAPRTSPPLPPSADMADPEAEVGNQFFDSFAAADDDRWNFMDDGLVGAGSTILRRVWRRSTAPPPTTES
jgi:hypothetical protein